MNKNAIFITTAIHSNHRCCSCNLVSAIVVLVLSHFLFGDAVIVVKAQADESSGIVVTNPQEASGGGGEAGKLDNDVGVGVDINEDIEVLYNPNTDQNISYGYWCSDAAFGCSFRMFSNIGGELLMVDSGSSNLAFCNTPNTARVYNVKRLSDEGKLMAQCATFSGGNHGWFGSSYIGSIVELEDTDEDTPTANSVFSVMDRIVGLNGNQCGPIKEGSIGLEQSAVRGIWGIAGIPGTGYNTFVYNEEIDLSTWPEKGDRMVEASTNGGTAQCKSVDNLEGCQCPVVAATLPTNFNSALARRGADRYAITWPDGTFGKNTGQILIGNKMNTNWRYGDQAPKIAMIRSARGVIKMNVLRMEVNGINIPINLTSYKIDTGSPKIALPREVYDAIKFDGGKNSPTVATITFLIPTLVEDSASNSDSATTITATKLELSATQELMEEGVFIPAPSSSGSTENLGNNTVEDNLVMGLNIMRYVEAIGFVFAPTPQPYLQFVPRTPQHILTPYTEIPVSENGLAGSFTNVTIDLDAYKTADPSGGCTYTTTTTRMTVLVAFFIVGSVSTVLSFF